MQAALSKPREIAAAVYKITREADRLGL